MRTRPRGSYCSALGGQGARSTVDEALYPAERHCTTVSRFQAGCLNVCCGKVHTTALKLVHVPDEGFGGFPSLHSYTLASPNSLGHWYPRISQPACRKHGHSVPGRGGTPPCSHRMDPALHKIVYQRKVPLFLFRMGSTASTEESVWCACTARSACCPEDTSICEV